MTKCCRLFSFVKAQYYSTREACLKGRAQYSDLLVLTSLDQLILLLKTLLFFTKQATLMMRSIVLTLLLQ